MARQRNLGRFTVRMIGRGSSGGGRRQEGRRSTVRLRRQRATEEEIEEAATVGDGGRARADGRGRGNGREGEKGSQQRVGVSRPEVAKDLDALADAEIANGTSGRNKVADSDHGRGMVMMGKEAGGLVKKKQREKGAGRAARRAGERRPWREKRREVVGFKNPTPAAERDGEG